MPIFNQWETEAQQWQGLDTQRHKHPAYLHF